MSFRSRRFLVLLVFVALFAVMISGQHGVSAAPSFVLTPTAEPPTATPLPTETPVPPTATPLPTETPVPPTATPLPTNTPVTQPTSVVATETPPPAPTNIPQPAATNLPAATNTPTAEAAAPTATPEPPVVLPVTGATMPGIPWLPIALGVAVFAAIGLLLGRRSNL